MSQTAEVRLSTNIVNLAAGEQADVTVTVTNTLTSVEYFSLSIPELDPSWYIIDYPNQLLYPEAPNNQFSSHILLRIPADALPGTYSVNVVTLINSAPEPVGFAQLTLDIREAVMGNQELAITPEYIETSGEVANFTINIRSQAGQILPVKLNVRPYYAETPPAAFQITPEIVNVPAYGSAAARLEVRPAQRNRVKEDTRYDFIIGAENQQADTSGLLIQTAQFPWLRTILITPWLLAVIGLLLFSSIAALLFLLFSSPNQNRQTAANPQAPVNTQPAACVTSADGRTAYVWSDGLISRIVVYDPANGTRRTVLEITGDNAKRLPGAFSSLLSFSPDGSQLIYVTADNLGMDNTAIFRAFVSANPPRFERITTVSNGFWPSRPVWNAQGNQIAFTVRNGAQLELRTVEIGANRAAVAIKTPTNYTPDLFYRDPGTGPLCWSQDGRKLVFAAAGSATQTEVSARNEGDPINTNKPDSNFRRTLIPASQTSASNNAALVPELLPTLTEDNCLLDPFSQNDPQWRTETMPGNEKERIGASGCPVAAAATIMRHYGANASPATIKQCLGTNVFDWTPSVTCSEGTVSLRDGFRNYFSWEELSATLRNGNPAIVGMLGGPMGIHFVVVMGGVDNLASTYRVIDPWDGTYNKSLGYFVERGYHLNLLIRYTPERQASKTCATRFKETIDAAQTGFPSIRLLEPQPGRIYQRPVTLNYAASSPNISVTIRQVAPIITDANQSNLLGTGFDGGTNSPRPIRQGDPVTTDGVYELVLQSPSSGEQRAARVVATFAIDRVAPEVLPFWSPNSAISENPDADGFYTVNSARFELGFQARDELTWISSIEYDLGGTGRLQPYTSDTGPRPIQFDLKAAGVFIINYQATDGGLNTSALRSFRIRVPASVISASATTTGTNPVGSGNGVPGIVQGGGNTPAAGQGGAAATTPAADAGSGGGTGGGSGSGGQTPAATTPPATTAAPVTTTPAPTTVAPPAPSVLLATNPQLTIEPKQDGGAFQIIVSGTLPVTWAIQQPTGAGASILSFPQAAGQAAGGQQFSIPISVSVLNFTNAPIVVPFTILYNNNTASLGLSVIIKPQPLPQIAFATPQAGPVATSTVPIQLNVVLGGIAVPSQVRIKAAYIDQNGQQVERFIGSTNAAQGYRFNWSINGLPPQDNIVLSANSCWTTDEQTCADIPNSSVTISIPRPVATIAIAPESPSLPSVATLSASVVGFVPVRVYYRASWREPAGIVPTRTLGSGAPDRYTFQWDTRGIPPQVGQGAGVNIDGRACWGNPDNEANCTPTNVLGPFTVPAPAITITPLVAPMTVNQAVGGTVSGLFNSPNSRIYVEYQFVNNSNQPETRFVEIAPSLTNGAGNWQTAINTDGFSAQTITMTAQACWTPERNGALCFKGTPVTGNIPEAVVTVISAGSNWADTLPVQVTATPAERVKSVEILLIDYTKTRGDEFVPQTSIFTLTNGTNGNFSGNVAAAATLGLRSGISVKLKARGCYNAVYCGAAGPQQPANVQIPNTTVTATGGPTTLVTTPFTFTTQLLGRTVSQLEISVVYSDGTKVLSQTNLIPNSTVILANSGAITVGSFTNGNWNWGSPTITVAPQTGIKVFARAIFGNTNTFDESSQTINPELFNLTLPSPKLGTVWVNPTLFGNPTGYFFQRGAEQQPNQTENLVPIPFRPGEIQSNSVISIPLKVFGNLAGPDVVRWYLQGENLNNGNRLSLITTTHGVGVTIPLPIGAITDDNSRRDRIYTLIAVPVWRGITEAADPTTDGILLPIKFVPIEDLLFSPHQNIEYQYPLIDRRTQVMLHSSVSLRFNIDNDNNNQRAVKQVHLFVSTPTIQPTQVVTVPVNLNGGNDEWTVTWARNLGQKFDPSDNVALTWQFCGTPNEPTNTVPNRGCASINTSGATFKQITNLTIPGVRLNLNSPLETVAVPPIPTPGTVGQPMPSTFEASITAFPNWIINPSDTVENNQGRIRFFAYPTNSVNPNDRVLLTTRYITITNKIQVTWPASPVVSGPGAQTPPVDIVRLMNQIAGTNFDLRLGLQMCLHSFGDPFVDSNVNAPEPPGWPLDPYPNPPGSATKLDNPLCSDWKGQELGTTFTNPGAWVSTVRGRQSIVVRWLSVLPEYDGRVHPFDAAIQSIVNPAEQPTRTIRVQTIGSANLVAPLSFQYSIANGTTRNITQTFTTVSEGVSGGALISQTHTLVWPVPDFTEFQALLDPRNYDNQAERRFRMQLTATAFENGTSTVMSISTRMFGRAIGVGAWLGPPPFIGAPIGNNALPPTPTPTPTKPPVTPTPTLPPTPTKPPATPSSAPSPTAPPPTPAPTPTVPPPTPTPAPTNTPPPTSPAPSPTSTSPPPTPAPTNTSAPPNPSPGTSPTTTP